jgi:hypothetical protein
MARRSKKTARTEKLEEPRSFRIKLRPKLSLHIDIADDGERDTAAGNCAGSVPASPPKNDPTKIPTRITDHRTGEVTDHPQRSTGIEEKPQKLALTPKQIAASNATLAAIRDSMKTAVAGEKLEVTPEPDEIPILRSGPAAAKPEIPVDDEPKSQPILTQAEIQALTKPDDESWFEAIDAVCEKIGIYGACRWFLGAVGAGAGGATVVWAVNKMLGQ